MTSHTRKAPRRYATLKAWRNAQGFTLQQAADFLDMPLSSYFNFENGIRIPRREAMKRIIDRTGVRIEFLAGVA